MDDDIPQPYKQPKPLYEHPGTAPLSKSETPKPIAPPPPIPQVDSTPIPTAPEPYTPKKLGKLKASKMLIKQRLNLLKKDKEVLLFPILSSIAVLIILIFVILITLFVFDAKEILTEEGSTESLSTSWYIFIFVMNIISMFIVTYFQAGLVTIVEARINGQDKSFKDGINNANAHIGKIFTWSLISATVGLVLQIISDKSKWAGKLVATLFGAAWGIVTIFIIPVLILDDLSIKDSIKKSGNIIKHMWGETIIMNFSTGLFFGLIIFAIFTLSIILGILTGFVITFIILPIILTMFTILLSNTLGAVFKIVLYHYATTNKIVEGFDKDLVMGAVKKK